MRWGLDKVIPPLTLGPYVSVVHNKVRGLAGPTVVFTRVNVQIESVSGATVDSTGLGNLIIGYDEDNYTIGNSDEKPYVDAARYGSHKLIVGSGNEFMASGTIVGGFYNLTSADYADITGGEYNTASGDY